MLGGTPQLADMLKPVAAKMRCMKHSLAGKLVVLEARRN